MSISIILSWQFKLILLDYLGQSYHPTLGSWQSIIQMFSLILSLKHSFFLDARSQLLPWKLIRAFKKILVIVCQDI